MYIKGADEDAWTDNEIVVNFLAHDEESGIEYCEWAVGTFSYNTIPLIKQHNRNGYLAKHERII